MDGKLVDQHHWSEVMIKGLKGEFVTTTEYRVLRGRRERGRQQSSIGSGGRFSLSHDVRGSHPASHMGT